MTAISDLVTKAGCIVSPNGLGCGVPQIPVSGGGLTLPTGGLWEWAALSGAAVVVSGVLLAFMYLWSVLFRNQPLEAYVRQELYELVVSAVLAIFIIGLVGAMGSLTLGNLVPDPDQLLPPTVPQSTNVYVATAMYYQQVTSDMESWLNLN